MSGDIDPDRLERRERRRGAGVKAIDVLAGKPAADLLRDGDELGAIVAVARHTKTMLHAFGEMSYWERPGVLTPGVAEEWADALLTATDDAIGRLAAELPDPRLRAARWAVDVRAAVVALQAVRYELWMLEGAGTGAGALAAAAGDAQLAVELESEYWRRGFTHAATICGPRLNEVVGRIELIALDPPAATPAANPAADKAADPWLSPREMLAAAGVEYCDANRQALLRLAKSTLRPGVDFKPGRGGNQYLDTEALRLRVRNL